MEIIQVVPRADYKVFVCYEDNSIRLFDAKNLLDIYPIMKDIEFFINRCTIMNDTLAWDVSGNMDDSLCIDIAPESIEESDIVKEEDMYNYINTNKEILKARLML
ncbi:DUF2442 domain-containing protein [Clostridium sp.]|uniref:DUF2442 domain-containing protein n=1 Tax=Clostridium sp. TaxID=1506 RepID=UPI003F418AFA